MFCTNCGAQNGDEANFCQNCGTPISRRQEPSSVDAVEDNSTENVDSEIEEGAPRKKSGPVSAIVTVAVFALLIGSIFYGFYRQRFSASSIPYSPSPTMAVSASAAAPAAGKKPSSTTRPKITPQPTTENGGILDDVEAVVLAKEIVLDNLKSPSTAKFCGWDTFIIRYVDGTYYVAGWVDAQNSYGATLRQKWAVCFTPLKEGKDIGYKDAFCQFE